MNWRYVVGAIFLGIAACTTPGPEMPDSSAVAASAPVNPDTPICKMERVTGSIVRQKVCLSAAERKRIEEGAHDFIDVNRRIAGEQR